MGSFLPKFLNQLLDFHKKRAQITCCKGPLGFITNTNMATVLTYEICATTTPQGRASIFLW